MQKADGIPHIPPRGLDQPVNQPGINQPPHPSNTNSNPLRSQIHTSITVVIILLLHLPAECLASPHGHHHRTSKTVVVRYRPLLLQQCDCARVAGQAIEVWAIEAGKGLKLVQGTSLHGTVSNHTLSCQGRTTPKRSHEHDQLGLPCAAWSKGDKSRPFRIAWCPHEMCSMWPNTGTNPLCGRLGGLTS